MADAIDVRVPDIGDFKDIPVIEVLVKPGDAVKKNDSIVTLESDKASMEVPAPADGTVDAIKVKVGDKVSQGSVILSLSPETPAQPATSPSIPQGDRAAAPPSPAATAPAPAAAPPAAQQTEQVADLKVPDIGDFKDVPVIEVLVKPGDSVEKNASIVVLESEKASMEVPASMGGTIVDVRVKPGDKVAQGSVIATVRTVVAAAAAPPVGSTSSPALRQAQDDTAKTAPSPKSAPATQPSGNGAVHASPSIRRFARELGVDLHNVSASGPNGRVTRDDVQQFVKHALQDGGAVRGAGTGGLPIAPWPKVDFAQYGEIERNPLSRIKKLSGPNLHRNWVMIPHVTQNDDADVTELEEFRKELNAEYAKQGVKVTMLAFLIKAAVAALKKFPDFNSSLDGDELVLKRYYNIGFAADTPGGLIVPVIKNADTKGIAQIAQ